MCRWVMKRIVFVFCWLDDWHMVCKLLNGS